MQKITPFLWFNTRAEEAATFYTSIFRDSKIRSVTRYGDAGPGPKGQVMTVAFELRGVEFVALNGGPQFTFSPAISFVVNCESQQDVDDLWERLAAGGRHDRCGWLVDKFGVSWQIVPTALPAMLADPDPERSRRVVQAMMQMTKLDIEALQRARDAG